MHYSFLPVRRRTPAGSISFTRRYDATQRSPALLTKVYSLSFREELF
jgi:hypothetical protein